MSSCRRSWSAHRGWSSRRRPRAVRQPAVPGAPPPTNNVPTNTAPAALAPAAAPRPGGAGKEAKFSDEDFAATLADVQLGGADFRSYLAIGKLNQATVDDDRRAEVCAAVEPLTQEANSRSAPPRSMRSGPGDRRDGLRTDANPRRGRSDLARRRHPSPGQDPHGGVGHRAANFVPNVADRGNAVAALRQLGPFAEAATLPLLKHPDHMVRYEACNILGDMGGSKSLAAMKKQVKSDQHVWSRTAADIALKKLASKPQTPAKSKSTGSSKSSASKSSGSKTNSKTKRPEDDDSFGKD